MVRPLTDVCVLQEESPGPSSLLEEEGDEGGSYLSPQC